MGVPNNWMVYDGQSENKMDGDWGYPHFRKPLNTAWGFFENLLTSCVRHILRFHSSKARITLKTQSQDPCMFRNLLLATSWPA